MKITHVVENLHRGGLERVVLDLVGEQSRMGHDCQIVCLYELGQLASELSATVIPVNACGKRRGPDLRAVWRLRRLLRQHRSDVVHTHNMVCNYHVAIALALHRQPVLINTRHGMGPRVQRGRRVQLYRHALRRTARVVSVCETARECFVREGVVGVDKLLAIPNGIHIERFSQPSDVARQRLLSELGLPAETRLAGAVGRLNRIKDPAALVRAFAALHQRMPDIALLLIGDGPLRQELTGLIAAQGLQHCIRLLGDRNDIPQLLTALDVFVMASVSEGYSMALLEACAAGLPIVATAVGGNPEIVHDGRNGLLVPARDEQALAAALGTLFADPERMQMMGRAGRDWVVEHGSLQAMATRYEELYRQCL